MKTIGIKLADGSFYSVLEEGQPTEKTLELTTAHNNQTKIMVDLYRSADCSMDDAEYVDSLQIENLVAHPNGEPSIAFDVSIDENNKLSAKIRDPETGGQSKTTITLVSRTLEERLSTDEYNISEPQESKPSVAKKVAVGGGLLAAAAALMQAREEENPAENEELNDEPIVIEQEEIPVDDTMVDEAEVTDGFEFEDIPDVELEDVADVNDGDVDLGDVTEVNDGGFELNDVADVNDGGFELEDVADVGDGDIELDDVTEVNDGGFELEDAADVNDGGFELEDVADVGDSDVALDDVTEVNDIGFELEDAADVGDGDVELDDVTEVNDISFELDDVADVNDSDVELEDAAEVNDGDVELGDVAEVNDVGFELDDVADVNDGGFELEDVADVNDSNIELNDVTEFDDISAQLDDIPDVNDSALSLDEVTETNDSDFSLDDATEVNTNDINLDDTAEATIADFGLDDMPEITTSDNIINSEEFDLASTEDLGSENVDFENDFLGIDSETSENKYSEQEEESGELELKFPDDNFETETTEEVEEPVKKGGLLAMAEAMREEENIQIDDDDFNFDDFNDFDVPETSSIDTSESILTDDDFDFTPSNEISSGPISFSGLYDKETELGDSAANFEEDEIEKKTKVPVIICVLCAIICILVTVLLLFVIPSKYNLLSKQPKEKIYVEKTVQETPAPEPVLEAEPIPEPEPEPIIEPEPIPEAKEDEVIVIEQAEEVVPVQPPVVVEKPKNITYKIKWGDTLWDIADTYYKNPWRYKYIARYNKIKDPDYIISGTYITIPAE